MHTTARACSLMLAPLVLLGAGCATERDSDLRLGGEVALEAVSPEWHPLPEGLSSRPSSAIIERGEWDELVVLVPIDGVDRWPGPGLRWPTADAPARLRGEHPDAERAVDLERAPAGRAFVEGLAAPFVAVVDLLTLPARMAGWRMEDGEGRPLDWRRRTPRGAGEADMETDR